MVVAVLCLVGGFICYAFLHEIAGQTFRSFLAWLSRRADAEIAATPDEHVTSSFRVVSGAVEGFGPSWTSGVAHLATGRIRFVADGLEREFAVASFGAVAPDRSSGAEQNARVRVHSDSGVLEWSLNRRVAERAVAIVVPR